MNQVLNVCLYLRYGSSLARVDAVMFVNRLRLAFRHSPHNSKILKLITKLINLQDYELDYQPWEEGEIKFLCPKHAKKLMKLR